MKKTILDRLNKYKGELQQLEQPKMDKRIVDTLKVYGLKEVIKELEYLYGRL